MKHRSGGATALLGMPGFVVGAQLEVDGEIWLHVETTAEVVGLQLIWNRCSPTTPPGVERTDRRRERLIEKARRIGHGFRNLDNYRSGSSCTVG